MKQNKIVFGALVILSLWISLYGHACAQHKPDSLEFRIGMEKDTFLVSEPIWLDLYMTNLAGEKVGIKPLTPASDWLKIIIVNSKNDTIPYKGEMTDWIGGGPTFAVHATETLYICRDLLEGTGFGILERWIWGRSYLEPETYRIIAIYKRHLESSQLTFTAVNPTGNEKIALLLWRQGYENRRKKKVDVSIEKWKELIERYPKSVYAPSALRELCYYDSPNSRKHAERLLSTYPNSGYSGYAIGILLQNKPEEEKAKIYQEVEKKYAGTRAEKLARNIRKRILAY